MICIGFKRCTKCGEIKGLSEFSKGSDKIGLDYWCKKCKSQYGKQYEQDHKEERKRYRQDHKEENNKRQYKYRKKNKERNLREGIIIKEKRCPKCGKIKSADKFYKNDGCKDGLESWCKDCMYKYRQDNKEAIQKRVKQYQQNHKEERKQYEQDHKEERNERTRKRCQTNKERNLREGITIKEKRCTKCGEIKSVDEFREWLGNKDGLQCWCKDCYKKYIRIRLQVDLMFKLNLNISCLVRYSLKSKGGSKQGKRLKEILDSLGYTIEDLITHLESKFEDGMTWENHGNGPGKWNIDHIRPIASFNFTSPDDPEFKQCWALENLQPLWWEENIKKGAKYDG